MSKYTIRTTIPKYWQRLLADYCLNYAEIKKDLKSDDEKTKELAKNGLQNINWCLIAAVAGYDQSGRTVSALFDNVCEGISYDKMKNKPPCGKNQFYKIRKEFFELLYERGIG